MYAIIGPKIRVISSSFVITVSPLGLDVEISTLSSGLFLLVNTALSFLTRLTKFFKSFSASYNNSLDI